MAPNSTSVMKEAVGEVLEGLSLRGFLRLFYIVSPYDADLSSPEKVPNYLMQAFPLFFILIFLEILVSVVTNRKHIYSVSDSITSLNMGLLQQILKLFSRSAELFLYFYVWQHHSVVQLNWASPWTWLAGFFVVDFGYYWFHRAAHEVNLFWAIHQVHHSSECYNLSTALRQGMSQQFTSIIFYTPGALFVPPAVFILHAYLNLIYQFWIHTQLLSSIGPLEYVLNTPSHHRVHHGRNPYCIDKNYGGTLIIWDRIFGTFAEEKSEEQIAYGLLHPVNTFDPVSLQMSHLSSIFTERVGCMSSITDKFKAVFCGPGWMPGTGRLGDDDYPQIEGPVKVYEKPLSTTMAIYCTIQTALSVLLYLYLQITFEDASTGFRLAVLGLLLTRILSSGFIFDHKPQASAVEMLYVLGQMLLTIWWRPTWHLLHISLALVAVIFALRWTHAAVPDDSVDENMKKID